MEAEEKSLAYRLGEARRLAGEMFAILQTVNDRPVMLAALDLLRGKVRARTLQEDAERRRLQRTPEG